MLKGMFVLLGLLQPSTRTAASSSPRQPEHYEQRAIEVFGCFPINMADDAPYPVVPESDHLVGHNL
jgi:hypothetical protein